MDDFVAQNGEDEVDVDEDVADGDDEDDDDDACGAVLTLISVLGSMNAASNDDDDKGVDDIEEDDDGEEWKYYLPMLPPKKRCIDDLDVVVDYMGCELPPSTYRRLSKKDGDVVAFAISSAMRAVLAHHGDTRMDVDGEDEEEKGNVASFDDDVGIVMDRIAPLVASIVMHSLRRLEKEGGRMIMPSSSLGRKYDAVINDATGVRCRADRDVHLILGLVSSIRAFRSFIRRLYVVTYVCIPSIFSPLFFLFSNTDSPPPIPPSSVIYNRSVSYPSPRSGGRDALPLSRP